MIFQTSFVGAGTILDTGTARRCIEAGATFLTSTGLDLSVVELCAKENVLVIPGALTPTEIINAWKAGADLVKAFPCSQLGEVSYLKALRVPLPHGRFVAAGGVNQGRATDFILAGAVAIGQELIPKKAVQLRSWIGFKNWRAVSWSL